MFGTVDTKVKPIRIAYLVEPNRVRQVREAIRLSSSLWGGSYSPIIPLYKRMPATWKDGPVRAPAARNVILGYIEAFDPDVLVPFTDKLPAYISKLGLRVVQPSDVWSSFDGGRHISPQFGVGIFELLADLFREHFKYKAKYPIKVVIPKISGDLSLFWASIFGELSSKLYAVFEKEYAEPICVFR